jgi:hypothetical protein
MGATKTRVSITAVAIRFGWPYRRAYDKVLSGAFGTPTIGAGRSITVDVAGVERYATEQRAERSER